MVSGWPSWDAWRMVLKAAFALPLTAEQLVVFGELAWRACASEATGARTDRRRGPALREGIPSPRC